MQTTELEGAGAAYRARTNGPLRDAAARSCAVGTARPRPVRHAVEVSPLALGGWVLTWS